MCRGLAKLFYRQLEVQGDNQLTAQGGTIYCANHVNALVDPALVQATTPNAIRPLARSGLFKSKFFGPWLNLMGAIPIYRAKEGRDQRTMDQNQDSFRKVTELLSQNENVVIFPEGQSHSDSHLSKLKTGAARMALSAAQVNNHPPALIPIGLNFSHKGRFRGDVLVKYGAPIFPNAQEADPTNKQQIDALTAQIEQGLKSVTLNTATWQDMRLVKLLERFFAMRRGKRDTRSLGQRFSGMQRIIQAQKVLRTHAPEQVRQLTTHLRFFDKLCRLLGIQNYHLDIEYRPKLVITYTLRILITLVLTLPFALLGTINGLIPYYLSHWAVLRFAKDKDQIDTARILSSLFFFGLFWLLQSLLVHRIFGLKWVLIYGFVVIFTSALTLFFRREIRQMARNARVFFMFVRKRQLRAYILHKRDELVVEIANTVRLSKQLMKKETS